MHHPAAIRVVEVVSSLVQRAMLARRSVQVHNEDPFESLLAQLAREIDKDSAASHFERRKCPQRKSGHSSFSATNA